MEVNLQELNYKDEILINEKVIIPASYLENTEIINLNDVLVIGDIKCDVEYNYIVNFKLTGQMIIHDALTYDEIPYDFTILIEEKLGNSLKSLDLIEFLWHYIVLEIPLRYTTSDNVTSISGKDYQVISEEEYKNNNNPFKDFFKE